MSVIASSRSESSEYLWNERRSELKTLKHSPQGQRGAGQRHGNPTIPKSRITPPSNGYAYKHRAQLDSRQSNADRNSAAQRQKLLRLPNPQDQPRVIDNTNYRNYLKKRYPLLTRAKETPSEQNASQYAVESYRPRYTMQRQTSSVSSRISPQPPARRKKKVEVQPDTWPGDRESPNTSQRQPKRSNEALNLYTYFVEHHRFAWEFTEEFIEHFLDDELIPDVLIETVTAAMSYESAHVSSRQLHDDLSNHRDITQECVEQLIAETLEDEIVPDLLIDLFKELDHGSKLTPRKPTEAKALKIMHEVLREVIPGEIREIVSTEVVQQSNNILQKLDVVEMTTTFLVDSVIQEESVSVVRQALRELANDELRHAAKFDVLNQIISEFIQEEVLGIVKGSWGETALDFALDENVIDPKIEDMCREIAMEVLDYYDNKLRRRDLVVMKDMGAEKPMAALALDILLSEVEYDAQAIGTSKQGHRHLESLALEILLNQDDAWRRDRNLTLSCQPLWVMNQRMAADVAMEVLSDELTRHADEDLCDLDCEEVQDQEHPRYISGLDKAFYMEDR